MQPFPSPPFINLLNHIRIYAEKLHLKKNLSVNLLTSQSSFKIKFCDAYRIIDV